MTGTSSRIRRTTATIAGSAATGALAALVAPLIVASPAAASSARSPYSATILKLFSAPQMKDTTKPSEASKQIHAMATSLRDSKPPADGKNVVNAYASALDAVAKDVLKIKSKSDYDKFVAGVGKNKKLMSASDGLVRYIGRICP